MKRLRYAAVALAAVLASMVVVRSAEAQVAGCLPDVGKRVPVLMVHGFNADERTWGQKEDPATMIGRVAGLSNVFVDTFDYRNESRSWVTRENLGPRLAREIACRAASSREQGGKGKVVVVAHSMGGLATRFAAAQTVHGRKVSDDIGLVVTIATPNTGSDLARDAAQTARDICNLPPAFRPREVVCDVAVDGVLLAISALSALRTGSPELEVLPGWPQGVPVYAMAGNITPTFLVPWIVPFIPRPVDGPPSGSDTLVTTRSALQGQVVNGIGGTREFGCKAMAPLLLWVTRPDCEHGALVRNQAVQQQTAEVIGQYVVQLNAPPPAPKTPPCPSAKELVAVMDKSSSDMPVEVENRVDNGPVCEGGRAGAMVDVSYVGGMTAIFKFQNGEWQIEELTEGFLASYCEKLPPKLRAFFKSFKWACESYPMN